MVDDLLSQTLDRIAHERRWPESTYRLQFHAGFTFRDATALVPYLHDLGVTDLYASPYLKARPGSKHGYDIADHRVLNPEIGSEDDFNALVAALRAHGMGQLLDVVPNHMGIADNDNVWWNDVLENGPSSPYAPYFDIDWHSEKTDLYDKVLLPLLGDPYGKALESGQLRINYDAGAFTVHYYERRFPLSPGTFDLVLRHRLEELEQALGPTAEAHVELQSILTAIKNLPSRSVREPVRVAERQREKEVVKRRLAALVESSPAIRTFIERNVELFNGTPGEPRSFDLLDDLLNAQAYRLSYWRVASDEINYRRFFDVNELAALSMERPEVFAATHELIFRLLRERKVTGLRIDHPDGLYDPKQYLERLQEQYVVERAKEVFAERAEWQGREWNEVEAELRKAWASGSEKPLAEQEEPPRAERAVYGHRAPLYVVVEKILGREEPLPDDWPVYGTVGYEFLNWVNALFVDGKHLAALNRLYNRWTDMDPWLGDLVYQKKFLIMQVALSSELYVLAHQLDRLSEMNRWSRDFTLNSLRHALREIIACFPVYRSYISDDGVPERDRAYINLAVIQAKRKNPAISAMLFDFVQDVLLLRTDAVAGGRQAERHFVGKFQQVTSPVMAKGLEDTVFYVFNRLLSQNEVGGDPAHFGMPVEDFYHHLRERRDGWARALSATSTHDTKRSEDVRARLNVLSELPREWQAHLARWNRINRRHRVAVDDVQAPDANDLYLFYQNLIGAVPLEQVSGAAHAVFVERMQSYMQKAIHEAKVHTSWVNPNPAYDDAIGRFVAAVLDERKNARFLNDVRAFVQRLNHFGLFNSLAQVLLKITAPGVPDIYQGQELWDFSLVDPDNRRPVDYERRRRMLRELKHQLAAPRLNPAEFAHALVASKEDARIKLYVTYRGLHARRDNPGLFAEGEFLAVNVTGSRRENVISFLRRQENRYAVAVAPRLVTQLAKDADELPLGEAAWQDTTLVLPGVAADRPLRNVFTGETLSPAQRDGEAFLLMADVLQHFPVALFVAQD